jgi:hypothetical protein
MKAKPTRDRARGKTTKFDFFILVCHPYISSFGNGLRNSFMTKQFENVSENQRKEINLTHQ